MTEVSGTAMVAVGVLSGLFVGWVGRGLFDKDERDRLRAKLLDCQARLDAVTAHTMARRQARAEASRKGWQTKRGKAQLNQRLEQGGPVLCLECADKRGLSVYWDHFHYGTSTPCDACGAVGNVSRMPAAVTVDTKGGAQ